MDGSKPVTTHVVLVKISGGCETKQKGPRRGSVEQRGDVGVGGWRMRANRTH